MKILAIETSCDETAVAVLEFNSPAGESNEKPKILWETLSSQVDIHAATFGIVPEIASRLHSEILPQFLKEIDEKIGLKNIDYIATTTNPGLLGSLLVGNNFARMLGYLYQKPIIPVNHLLGHFYASFINLPLSKLEFPALGLIVSGGHTMLILATRPQRFTSSSCDSGVAAKNEPKAKTREALAKWVSFKIIGETRDDAAGEAFDKIARLLNLGYPGGPAVAQAASQVKESPFKFTTPMTKSGDFDFSFSGLKTQVRMTVEQLPQQCHPELVSGSQSPNHCEQKSKMNELTKTQIAFAAQSAIVDSLVAKSFSATAKFKPKIFILGGGVSANQLLREKLVEELSIIMPKNKIFLPEKKYSTDNATMIALAAYLSLPKNVVAWDKLQTSPSSDL